MFNRRLLIFGLLVACGAGVVLARLVQMQLVQGQRYAAAAEESLRFTRRLQTHRGEILDRHGRILAVDQPCFEFTMAYPALLTSWASRQSRRLMDEQGLTADQAVQRVRQQLIEAHELALMERWAGRSARTLGRREGATSDEVLQSLAARIEWTLDRAAEVAGVSRAEVDEEIDRIVSRVWRVRALVKLHIEEETASHGVIRALDESTAVALRGELPWMLGGQIAPSTRRWYPYGSTAAHVIGLTGRVAAEDVGMLWRGPPPADEPGGGELIPLAAIAGEPATASAPGPKDGDPDLLEDWPGPRDIAGFVKEPGSSWGQAGHEADLLWQYRPGQTVGLTGAERMAEPVLRGRCGRQVRQRSGLVLEEVPAVPGRNVRLTLDIELQQAIERQVLDGRPENGAAVIIDIPTGQVLVLASKPRYDLNQYRAEVESLAGDAANLPLLHRAVAAAYPPGSTVKPLVALAAAAAGALGPGQPVECRGFLHTPDAFRCWIYKQGGGQHGPQAMRDAIKHSCNIYFYTAGERLGVPGLLDWLRRFGLGERPGTLLPEEKPGRVPTAAWLWRRYERGFRVGDARMMAIGQSLLEATPLQVANAMATVARGGVHQPPVLLLGGPRTDPPQRRDLHLPEDALAAVQGGMEDVVNDAHGTAHKYAYDPELPTLCGKTGTAQAWPRRIDSNGNGRIDSGDQIVQQGDMAWFAGYVPRASPRIAFAIVMEYTSEGGGAACGPMALDLVRLVRDKGYLR